MPMPAPSAPETSEAAGEAVDAAPANPAGTAPPKPRRRLSHDRDARPMAPTVVEQIRELEAQLDRLIDEASRRDVASLDRSSDDDEDDASDLELTRRMLADTHLEDADSSADLDGVLETRDIEQVEPPLPRPSTPPPSRAGVPPSRASVPDRLSASSLGGNETTVFDTARELLSTDFYLRKWGRLAMRGRSEEVDDFGFDPIYEQKARTVLEFLYTRYFRVETTGIDRVPARGRCLLVANHSGTVPLDGVMLKTAVKLEHSSPRDVRWLTEDFIYHMPYLGSTMNRLGAVRACQENAERLLGKEQLCAVFPEGVKGIGKLFSERYRLQRFGRGGFIKLCLRTHTPIVPVAVVGAEETNPLLFKVEYLSKALGLPYVPVTPTFPALGPLGLLPAPTKWQIHFGEPIDFSGHGRDAADDELLVGKLAERVRATIQGMLDRAVGSRRSVFFG
jgi:1-acyl-sn-glycerol-3-phosphate acyltransferase